MSKCRRCGADKVWMNFGFAGADLECPNGPWGTGDHDSLEMQIHRSVPVILGLLMAVFATLVFFGIAFSHSASIHQ